MAETTRLSVERAPERLREADAPRTGIARLNDEIEELGEETQRLRTQRLHLERHQARSRKR